MDYDPDCLDQAHLAAQMDAGLTGTSPEPDKAANSGGRNGGGSLFG